MQESTATTNDTNDTIIDFKIIQKITCVELLAKALRDNLLQKSLLTNHDKCKTVALRCTKERFISSVCDMWCGLLLKPCFLMPTIFFCKACCPTAEFLQQSFCICIHSCRMRRGDAKRNYISKVRYHLPIALVLVPLQHST